MDYEYYYIYYYNENLECQAECGDNGHTESYTRSLPFVGEKIKIDKTLFEVSLVTRKLIDRNGDDGETGRLQGEVWDVELTESK